MSFQEALDAAKEMRKARLLRSLVDRDDLIGERNDMMEPIETWAEEISEKVDEVKDLLAAVEECEYPDLRDFQDNLRYGLGELLELMGQDSPWAK